MQEEKRFFRTVCTLAIPAALQSLLQSSFSLVDQIMIGQLGAVSVAAVGLAGNSPRSTRSSSPPSARWPGS